MFKAETRSLMMLRILIFEFYFRNTAPAAQPTVAAKLFFGGPGRISDFWILTLTRSSPSPIYLQM
jgi:hypothetical protein